MAWQRTIPFGYRMHQGRIICDETESRAVREIFNRYLRGDSLKQIAEALTATGIRYHRHTASWNKNMINRIMENNCYIGDEQYPCIIDEKDYLAARLLKADKSTYAPCKVDISVREKAVCGRCGAKMFRATRINQAIRWKCEDAACNHTTRIKDERLVAAVTTLLDELAHTPGALAAAIPQESVQDKNAQRIANELTNALNRGTESPEYLRSLIFACAAERYNELPDSTLQYEVDKLRKRMEKGFTDESLPQELLKTAVRAIHITDADNIVLELVNGQIITKEAAGK